MYTRIYNKAQAQACVREREERREGGGTREGGEAKLSSRPVCRHPGTTLIAWSRPWRSRSTANVTCCPSFAPFLWELCTKILSPPSSPALLQTMKP